MAAGIAAVAGGIYAANEYMKDLQRKALEDKEKEQAEMLEERIKRLREKASTSSRGLDAESSDWSRVVGNAQVGGADTEGIKDIMHGGSLHGFVLLCRSRSLQGSSFACCRCSRRALCP